MDLRTAFEERERQRERERRQREEKIWSAEREEVRKVWILMRVLKVKIVGFGIE
jgi:hypothetical protein